ncbi:hypothetical protein BGM25_15790 [Bacillus sp. FJAT-29953]|nr:hypothetical protein [Bacillus sp. FJAT-29953]
MDAELVERITRLVLSKLQEYSEPSLSNEVNRLDSVEDKSLDYPPLTEQDLKNWQQISMSIGFSEVSTKVEPLTQEEINVWKNISASIGFKKKIVEREPSSHRPLTEEEINNWNRLSVNTTEKGQVKFFPHHN